MNSVDPTAPNRAVALGIDVGGTKIAGGVVRPSGEILTFATVRTPRNDLADPDLQATHEMSEAMSSAATSAGAVIEGVGIGFPEYVSSQGTLVSREVVGWTDSSIERLRQRQGVVIESDVRGGGLGEASFGAGRDLHAFVYISVGTGISYCLIEHGRARSGYSGGAIALGELDAYGAQFSAEDLPPTLEQYASGAGLARRYEAATGRHATDGARGLISDARRGDEVAHNILTTGGRSLAAGVASLVHLLDPEGIVLGGGLISEESVYLDAFLDELATRLARRGGPLCRRLPVRRASLGSRAGVTGLAVAVYLSRGIPLEDVGRPAVQQTLAVVPY